MLAGNPSSSHIRSLIKIDVVKMTTTNTMLPRLRREFSAIWSKKRPLHADISLALDTKRQCVGDQTAVLPATLSDVHE